MGSSLNLTFPSDNFTTSLDQFYCQSGFINKTTNVKCMSFSQFAEAPFEALCNQSCLQACQDVERIYEVLPSGSGSSFGNDLNLYGQEVNVSTLVTLYGICSSYANISRALTSGIVADTNISSINIFFPEANQSDLEDVASAVSHCLISTCDAAIDSTTCEDSCSPAALLTDSTTPDLLSSAKCLVDLCESRQGLPFGNQEVVGIGITWSYIIQSVLVLLSWTALTSADCIIYLRPHHSETHKNRDIFLESLNSFQIAQCWFTIATAIAALVSEPFHTDSLNGWGLLPVAINGFLPQAFTLLTLHRWNRTSWYVSGLTFLSYILNSVVFWGLIHFFTASGWIGTHDSEYRSLSKLEPCGGSTGLSLCTQTQGSSPLGYLYYTIYAEQQSPFGLSTKVAVHITPAIWVLCTISIVTTLTHQYLCGRGTLPLGFRLKRTSHHRGTGLWTRILSFFAYSRTGTVAFYLASVIFWLSTAYQGVLFYNFVSLRLVDFNGWTFGQIVAITVWIPPILDYFHLQFPETISNVRKWAQPMRATKSREDEPLNPADADYTPRMGHAFTPTMNHAYERMSTPETGRRESFEDGDDNVSVSSAIEAHPEEFELRNRPTLREGLEA